MRDYIPFEYPATEDGESTAVLNEGEVLMIRRMQLGLTQHQVAEMAGIYFSQYQRLEGGERFFSGCSMRIGLAVCTVLRLDPNDFIRTDVRPAKTEYLTHLSMFDPPGPHKVGRRKIRKDIMELRIGGGYILVPESVLHALGMPKHIRFLNEKHKKRLLLTGADSANSIPVTKDGLLSIRESGVYEDPVWNCVKMSSGQGQKR